MKRLIVIDKNIFLINHKYIVEIKLQDLFIDNNNEYEIYYFPNQLSQDFSEIIIENANIIKLCSMSQLFPNGSFDVKFLNYIIQIRNKKFVLLPFVNQELDDFLDIANFTNSKTQFNFYVYVYLCSKYIHYVTYIILAIYLYYFIKGINFYGIDLDKKYFWLEYIKKI